MLDVTGVPQDDVVGHLDGVCIRFSNKTILKDVSLRLYKGQLHMLSGPSGCGKTTLLRALNRLNDCFDDHEMSGSIGLTLSGREVDVTQLAHKHLPLLRRKVGMVFQIPNLLPGSIIDNLLLPLKVVAELNPTQALARSQQVLVQVRLWDEIKDRLNHDASSLSGGQQQRLCLARTLALEPEILLLDEPTASLDPENTAVIEQLLQSLKQQYTMVMVSHCPVQTKRLADKTVKLDRQQIISS
ncbi:phosphate ABC transporter ATP-binding protein [Shewanella sp. Choline-02u-19]|uniref:phosphate ABC transporter ATP-binding protein n=1 Tax=unclassified Shewanella TaxID=196818 RepID=UPI000C333F27|nr:MULTISPECIES: phosphate ABC transporter ATP-binding protein [unclassified Shewanella]PKH62584.1 phosphate ABC transporter ATP-binding protein [Shewanella sp. Bg11-22]PKI27905.1 phosphate ABC transporter ATP-binding protein [Shewanella sp. Choline-02u-19]